ncbi:L-serine ammonia-lyase, iron-sulfur-dependent subunit beta [Thermohalobacter berrensis]|uniref:L-serine deaminase n=1 Tax=Thermohalobacter berrensis TaxID=99594 RepID=A0A419SV91_9FIRM|nr:L-serine ammonia-lyase, iron-sulfur-dependent subunit beta [Thermohalobacter berrensis]RKD29148.1 L-serine dehydratase, iron-sulfur-dependent subunit beta [Thermohalobacter berrensis]
MDNYSVFDILGPIMIGPSSSHTAGAAKIGKLARKISGNDFDSVLFYLHGSFAKTYKGHGTDRALVAGILGMEPYDERLRGSLKIANKKGIKVKFVETDLGYRHPNTVKIVFYKKGKKQDEIIGSSIGGGNVIITNINGYKVEFTGDYPTLITRQYDRPGIISKVTAIFATNNINIGKMKVNRKGKGQEASMVIETDSEIPNEAIKKILQINEIISARAINLRKKEV